MSDRNTKLMKEMGSKNGRYDPEPPDQWRWQLQHGSPEDRFVAWVKSKTIALGHHSPFVIDEQGNARYIEYAAMELSWEVNTTRNVAYRVHAQGRIRLDRKAKRIWLCADVQPQEVLEPSEAGRIKGELFHSVQSELPSYVVDFIENLENGKKDEIVREYEQFLEWQPRVIRDAVAAARALIAQVEDSILERYGVEKKRLPKRPSPQSRAVQLSLLEFPDFVQSESDSSVQTAQSTVYKAKNGSVQTENPVRTEGRILIDSDSLLSDPDPDYSSSSGVVINSARARTTTTQPPPPEAEKPRLPPEWGFDQEAETLLIAKCRKRNPAITIGDIVQLGYMKLDQLRERLRGREIGNPIGFLLKAIPNMVTAPRAARAGAD